MRIVYYIITKCLIVKKKKRFRQCSKFKKVEHIRGFEFQ